MKATLRIPTEMYAYIEVEIEKDSAEEVIDEYNRITALYKGGAGLTEKEFSAVLDELLSTGTVRGGVEYYEKMTPEQRNIMQTIKRSVKRINSRLGKEKAAS